MEFADTERTKESWKMSKWLNSAGLGIVCVGLIISCGAVRAADVTVGMTPEDVQNWANASTAFERCIADLQLKSDVSVCRGLSQWLEQQAGKVAIARQTAAAPPPQPPEQPPAPPGASRSVPASPHAPPVPPPPPSPPAPSPAWQSVEPD
jgi:hypothetical protein